MSKFPPYRADWRERFEQDLLVVTTQTSIVQLQEKEDKKRNYWYIKKYGITLKFYNRLLQFQEGKCAICNEYPKYNKNKKPQRLVVDHDHETGLTRGLLCRFCNYYVLGRLERRFKKRPGVSSKILGNASTYLQTPPVTQLALAEASDPH